MPPTLPGDTLKSPTWLPMVCHLLQHQSWLQLPPALEVEAAKALPLQDAKLYNAANACKLYLCVLLRPHRPILMKNGNGIL